MEQKYYRYKSDDFDLYYEIIKESPNDIVLKKILFYNDRYVSIVVTSMKEIPDTLVPITQEEYEKADERSQIRETIRKLARIGS
jgi:hypothetical protein